MDYLATIRQFEMQQTRYQEALARLLQPRAIPQPPPRPEPGFGFGAGDAALTR
jgi:hypothetical protein